MKASQMLVLTNMLAKIQSDVDDLKGILKEMKFLEFQELYEGEEE
jgi:hypothetical protein